MNDEILDGIESFMSIGEVVIFHKTKEGLIWNRQPTEWIAARKLELFNQLGSPDRRFQAILDYLDQLEDGQKYVRLASCDDTCMATPCPRHLATDGDYII